MSGISVLKSVYFRNIYLTFLACFLVVGLFLVFVINFNLRSSIKDRELIQIEEKLILLVPQAQKILSNLDYNQADSIFPQKYMLPNIRYTLIAPRGEVIADSHSLPETIVDGWSFPEVQLALKQEWGIDERYIEVIGEKALLIARAIKQNNRVIGIIRAELPHSVLYDLQSGVQRMIMMMAIISILLAFVFGFFISRSYAAPIFEIAQVCQAISQGNYHRRVKVIPKNEVGQLANTINLLSQDLLSKISSLSLERAQLSSILACMREGIISLTDMGKIQFCNLSTYQHLQIESFSDIRQRNIKDIKELDLIYPIWRQVIKDKNLVVKELALNINDSTNPNENQRFLRVYATFYHSPDASNTSREDNNFSGVMIVIDDNTEIKRLQQIRRQFFAQVSHELKTPLTSIRGYVETLQNSKLDSYHTSRFLDKIEDNANRMIMLVMDLLSLIKIESRKSKSITLQPVQWYPIIKQVVENHEFYLQKKHITVDIQTKTQGRLLVMGDYESMLTIFENLLTNAIRYSPPNSKITIRTLKKKSSVVLEVIDSGVGIAKEHHDAIFERFYRVDKARSRIEGGTGLGLSIVKQLCERINAQVTVSSEINKGSTFSVKLTKAF